MERPRNRVTDQGRRRPSMSTYYRSGATNPNRPSPFEKRLNAANPFKKFWFKAIDFLLIALVLLFLGRSLIVSSNAKVIASDTSYHSLNNYQDSAKRYLGALRDNNKVTFDSNAIAADFERDYPEVRAVAVELPVFSAKPVVRLQISEPSFFLQSGDKQYLLDSSGKVVALTYQYPKVKNLPLIIDQSGFKVEKGKQVLSENDIAFIKTILAHCRLNNIKLDSLTLPPIAQELDLRTKDRPYFVKFYLGGDSATQIGQFLAARHNFDQTGSQPSEYLDVRVSGKIFYK